MLRAYDAQSLFTRLFSISWHNSHDIRLSLNLGMFRKVYQTIASRAFSTAATAASEAVPKKRGSWTMRILAGTALLGAAGYGVLQTDQYEDHAAV